MWRKKNPENRYILVGAAAMVALAYFFVSGYLSDRRGEVSDDGYHVIGRFDSVVGITKGSPVLLAGLPVGQVVDVRLETETNTAVLEMAIAEGTEIPYDSVAKILTDGMMGPKYIKISPGGALESLRDGEEFEYVQDSILFQELLQKVILSAEARRRGEQDKQAGEEE